MEVSYRQERLFISYVHFSYQSLDKKLKLLHIASFLFNVLRFTIVFSKIKSTMLT